MEIEDAIFNKTRLRILRFIWNREETTLTEIEKLLKLGHATIIYHIDKLVRAGIINFDKQIRKQGQPVKISVTDKKEVIKKLTNILPFQ